MTDYEINLERRWRDVAWFSFGAAAGILVATIGLAILGASLG